MPDSSGTPTPRDRAVAVVALGIEEQISEFVHQRVDENGGGFEADATEAARAVVDALLASPDILRELAGQPAGTKTQQALIAARLDMCEALGMDPTRDWDDIVNAARCLRKNRAGE